MFLAIRIYCLVLLVAAIKPVLRQWLLVCGVHDVASQYTPTPTTAPPFSSKIRPRCPCVGALFVLACESPKGLTQSPRPHPLFPRSRRPARSSSTPCNPPDHLPTSSRNFGLTKIHLWVLLHKLLQHLLLLLLVTARLPHLLLPLIIHHLLHHGPRGPVQIAQLAVLRHDLGRVDRRRVGHHVRPPVHLVGFVQVDGDFFARAEGLERPG